MINIQVDFSVIGFYLNKAQSSLSKGKGRSSFFDESSKKRKVVKISRFLNLKTALIVLICLQLLIQAFISGMHFQSNLQLRENSAWVPSGK